MLRLKSSTQTNRACQIRLISSCVCFCLYGPFSCISFHKFSRKLSAFSLCSSDLISALLVFHLIIIYHHLSLYREGRWGTTDDFATSFLHFSLFSTALWDLTNSRPVHSLMLSSHLFLCLPCLLPPFSVPCKMVLVRPDEQET